MEACFSHAAASCLLLRLALPCVCMLPSLQARAAEDLSVALRRMTAASYVLFLNFVCVLPAVHTARMSVASYPYIPLLMAVTGAVAEQQRAAAAAGEATPRRRER